MSRLTISMPDQMNDWVEAQVSAGRYGNVSEYFRDLVRRDQERRDTAINELRVMLERAEASGVSKRSLSEILDAAREEARQKGLLDGEN
ncbi:MULTISPECIES: type II toxin-antitoxin system ParD family antitoxin [Paracoccaceae]|uniref:Type II toxin-antitoxin system ParD family antitoxin n=1 Tax=Phaeovulum veldkampii DSM 11550 TaxID=1185920 RepID=A0A2T4JHJ8_9RHOB|nr:MULTISPECIES: type II toxin-antitoxin system ParD family antitoxin [Paracoccaceae]MBK5946219.1 addiction module antitoxin [Phaeovulum veldkampii DSM 11550]NHM19693.1 type II toxin-antitoxin system ParD family antitoxin [Tritonibacter mobilis]NHM23842.1 type II toxin-antitoxin system ParD family antitoxin [Tritonibacter mobilis]PTE17395.1 type II toxin-antitoxin system ParD family antitoxin [Phaeovulum veldkampii DSM 11550]TDQ56612.1 antitoxin ParD1/3/4 [Phaeovulum veldkampii DSM 11550]